MLITPSDTLFLSEQFAHSFTTLFLFYLLIFLFSPLFFYFLFSSSFASSVTCIYKTCFVIRQPMFYYLFFFFFVRFLYHRHRVDDIFFIITDLTQYPISLPSCFHSFIKHFFCHLFLLPVSLHLAPSHYLFTRILKLHYSTSVVVSVLFLVILSLVFFLFACIHHLLSPFISVIAILIIIIIFFLQDHHQFHYLSQKTNPKKQTNK